MKSKKFLSIICAIVMMFALSIAVVQTKHVSAAETAKYYYGTSLVSSDSGSPSITSSLSDGVKVTFKKTNKSASVNYKHVLYTQNFEITFKADKTNFEELYFTLTDADNDTKWVKVSFKQVDGKLQYKFEDNENNKTEYANSGIASSKLESGVKLSLSNGEFKLDATTLDCEAIVTKSFYKNMASLSYGVEGVDNQGEDVVVCITEINSQSLVSSNNKFEGSARKNPVIIPMEDNNDQPIVSAQPAQNVKAPANEDYAFAYYCLDVLGTGWAVSVDGGDKVNGKATQAIGEVGSDVVVAKIYATDASDEALITLNITAVEDETSVTINDAQFDGFIDEKLADVHSVGHVVATKEGNTFEFPHIYRDDFATIFNCTDGIDAYNNVKIQVGYKAPGDNGNYTYVSSYAVKLNETGIWYFVYKATDVAGNEIVSEPFSFRVIDETAPTIKVSEKVQIIVDEKYTIPSATITDNASGVDSNYTKWTLYNADSNGNKTGSAIANLKFGEDGYEDSLLKDGVFKPTEAGKKYVVVYEARDKAGNIAESQETVIEVVEGTPTYTANPFNDFVKTALIVVACLAGLGLIILIFVRPKERSLK
ncbi:MAG: hypothetical protein E7344_02485 [Clostridiales bacterium]|nr:hypothetical protein [Clostridiales bacterium]